MSLSDNEGMNKILLVYEDYADLMTVEATLKKVGFDVIGITNEYSISEQMLAFNPDLVIGSGRGGRVSSLGVGKRLKEMTRWQGRSLLIFPANFKPNPQELIRIRVDMILESPVLPSRLVQVIGKILGHDEAVLLERLNKSASGDTPQKTTSGSPRGSTKFSTEEEAIYIKGSLEGFEPSKEGEIARKNNSSLDLEKVEEDSLANPLSEEERKAKFSFKFGDSVTEGASGAEPFSAAGASEAFPDVDLRALERELVGGGIPEVEKIEVAAEEQSISTDETAEARRKTQEDLKKLKGGLRERVAKYSKMVADVKLSPKSTVSRVEARRRQKNLAEDFDEQNLEKLDKLRQQFAKALFKK